MTADLADRIRSALDEIERIAREATTGPWTADTPYATDAVRSLAASIGEHQVWVADCRYEHMGPLAISNAAHIAHNDPAAVLRRVAAERRVLARHRPVECHCGTDWHTHRCRGCDRPWPCDEIRDQADRLGINTEETR